jgi:hypothetical protein
VQVALAAMLDADASIAARAPVYSLGTAPDNPPREWVELGDTSEAAYRLFGAGGNVGEETITVVRRRAPGARLDVRNPDDVRRP